MNEQQKQLAVDNLGLVYAYIHSHHLDEEEFYDLLVIELCNAATKFDISMGYSFSTFAYKCFDRVVAMHIRKYSQKKYKLEHPLIYLDSPIDGCKDADVLHELIPDLSKPDLTDHVIAKEMLQNIYSCCVNKRDIQIIKLLCMGYTQTEIMNQFKLGSRQSINNVLRRIRIKYQAKYGPFDTQK